MKLVYPRFKNGNFGDQLNPWLWDKLFPEIPADDDDRVRVLCIGSGLKPNLWQKSPQVRFAVLGAGAGYAGLRYSLGRQFPLACISLESELSNKNKRNVFHIPDTSRIYWIRGRLTARLLGLAEELVAGDPVLLLSRFVTKSRGKVDKIGYMPHFRSASFTKIETQCQHVGYDYIDPRDPVEMVIEKMLGCRLLITEALHGAIAADTFGIPWIPVSSSPHILPFKWHDYCSFVGHDYRPYALLPQWNSQAIIRERKVAPGGLMAHAIKLRAWQENVRNKSQSLKVLDQARHQKPNVLSHESLVACCSLMDRAMEKFQRDVKSGFWD